MRAPRANSDRPSAPGAAAAREIQTRAADPIKKGTPPARACRRLRGARAIGGSSGPRATAGGGGDSPRIIKPARKQSPGKSPRALIRRRGCVGEKLARSRKGECPGRWRISGVALGGDIREVDAMEGGWESCLEVRRFFGGRGGGWDG